MKKAVAVLKLSTLSVPQKIEFGRVLVTSMTGNANFPTPSPALTVLTANINALETAYINARSGGRDETAVMRTKVIALELSLKSLAGYVEGIANANAANGEAIVLSAGIGLKRSPATRANGFRIRLGSQPGEIMLKTDYERNSMFTWAVTLTPSDEETWEVLHASTKATYLATELQSGSRYYFRYAKTGSNGQGPWSHVLDLIAA